MAPYLFFCIQTPFYRKFVIIVKVVPAVTNDDELPVLSSELLLCRSPIKGANFRFDLTPNLCGSVAAVLILVFGIILDI